MNPCTKCGEPFHPSYFRKCDRIKRGYVSWCKNCEDHNRDKQREKERLKLKEIKAAMNWTPHVEQEMSRFKSNRG